MFCQKIPESYKFLLKDGENCVEFKDDLSDFVDKLMFYKENPDELKRVTSNAVDFFHNNWTWNHRAKELVRMIEDIKVVTE